MFSDVLITPPLPLRNDDEDIVVHIILCQSKNAPMQEPVSPKSRNLFGLEKPFVKLRPASSVKLVFSNVAKEIKIKITAKFRASRRLRFEDTRRIMSPEMRPKIFGTFEKRAPRSRKQELGSTNSRATVLNSV